MMTSRNCWQHGHFKIQPIFQGGRAPLLVYPYYISIMSLLNIISVFKFFKLTTNKYYFILFYALIVITFALIYWFLGTSEHLYFDKETNDQSSDNITLLNAFYFSIVTQSTTGYGDILPKSKFMRCMTILQLCLTVVALNLLL